LKSSRTSRVSALDRVSDKIEATFHRHTVSLTLGGEPTFVPLQPEGSEWSITALGPTKLRYAYALASALQEEDLPHAVDFYCPGKAYPGELNPRWAIVLVWNRDGSPLVPSLSVRPRAIKPTLGSLRKFRLNLLKRLGFKSGWLTAIDPFQRKRGVWVLPLDHESGTFSTEDWGLGDTIHLLRAEGPAGLRLPLGALPVEARRRALTVEVRDGEVHLFFPPLLQAGFLALLEVCDQSLKSAGVGAVRFAGYIPLDEEGRWSKLGLASDPGVLEINLPPCETWQDYRTWLRCLERAAAKAGLRSYKQIAGGEEIGTGGGNHLLFGGPSLDAHPLFSRPAWITSMLRYWQHHPSLSYLFTGQYVGLSSQAPRPDECAAAHYDLEMAYRFLEGLGPGDHRYLISETLRHLHTDGGGNTHRSEISFDKFWNVNAEGGCRGLIEFRAVESLPRAEWMSAVALLWRALAAWLLDRPFVAPLVEHGDALHDCYFLPSGLISDFRTVLSDLKSAGFDLPQKVFDEIIAWRLPTMLETPRGLIVRRGLEGWPLLCETPLEGGSTSRFVDTSIDRLEFSAPPTFGHRLFVQGRELPFTGLPSGRVGAGLRYRRSALYPSLHPGIPVQLPLYVHVEGDRHAWRLDPQRIHFTRCDLKELPPLGAPCRRLRKTLLTYDLRLP
jgi:uncharacterized protein (DUF2126 family)